MKLKTLLDSLDCRMIGDTKDEEIEILAYHSDEAADKSLFFAIEGRDEDGKRFIGPAIEKGCRSIVVEENSLLPEELDRYGSIALIEVKDVRQAMAKAAACFYGYPSKELSVIGVTGTKGKTSVSFMIREILERAGIKTGIIGTVFTGFEGCMEESKNTTPQSVEVQKTLRQMKEAGCRAVVMEVSSQGLMHRRVDRVEFEMGVFTNLSPDHIGEGEHRSYPEYRFWKSRLFTQCREAVLNADDKESRAMAAACACPKPIYYGKDEKSDFLMYNINLYRRENVLGVSLDADEGGRRRHLEIDLPGEFNAFNAMAAAAAARRLEIPWPIICEALKSVKIPGRAERVQAGPELSVLVDYAHNGVALDSLLRSLKAYEPARLIVLFGCGGERDRNRRLEMGRAAARWADVIIVTSDNPRRENPDDIIRDICRAIGERDGVIIIPDRREAIRAALAMGRAGDIIAVAGKGHETYQLIGDKRVHFDDREEIISAGKEKE